MRRLVQKLKQKMMKSCVHSNSNATFHSAIFHECKYAISGTDYILPTNDVLHCPYW